MNGTNAEMVQKGHNNAFIVRLLYGGVFNLAIIFLELSNCNRAEDYLPGSQLLRPGSEPLRGIDRRRLLQ